MYEGQFILKNPIFHEVCFLWIDIFVGTEAGQELGTKEYNGVLRLSSLQNVSFILNLAAILPKPLGTDPVFPL